MQEQQFVALVNRLEDYSRQHPSLYRLRVAALAVLGYAYLLGLLGIVLLLLAVLLYAGLANLLLLKLLPILIGFAAIILGALWIEFPTPEGQELEYEDDEFGHLSSRSSRFSAWVYRVRKTWAQVWKGLEDERLGSGVLRWFLHWYGPYFGAYSFVLARAQEYEADRCSVTLCGKDAAARTHANQCRIERESARPKFLA